MSLNNFKISNVDSKNEEKDEDENLWLDILSQVQESSSNKLPSCKHLLVLGDNESGKTSLVAKLQGNEDPKKGSGLEYSYIFVRDEYRDDHTRLGVWILDGDPWHRNLLKYVLNEDTFADTTVLLTASMTEPWNILESLQNWISILEEHIQRLKLPKEQLQQHKNRIAKKFQDYFEPGAEIVEGVMSPLKPIHGSNENLSNTEIKVNLGLDIIVIITKTDYISTLEKQYDYKDEHFDFIQLTIRNFCLCYGASLFYVSVKEDKNCDLLLKYLVHRVFSFPFRTPALVVDKDAVFIPAGWDNSKKSSILIDNLTSMQADDSYNDVIVKPLNHRKPLQREAEIVADDDQSFLGRLQSLINQQVPATVGRPVSSQETPMRAPAGVQKTAERRISGSPGMQASPKKIEGKAGTVGGEGVLQNFFNSLLNRRTGSPIGGPLASVRTPGVTDRVSSRHDAVAELDRMAGRKAPSFSQTVEPSSNEDGSDDSSMKS